jgi:hypothetical protein
LGWENVKSEHFGQRHAAMRRDASNRDCDNRVPCLIPDAPAPDRYFAVGTLDGE